MIKKESTCEKGRKLENIVLSHILPYDKRAHLTKGSGSGLIKGDVTNNLGIFVECKNHKNKNINFKIEDWDKSVKDIPNGSNKHPLAVTRVDDGRDFVILELCDFFNYYVDEIFEKEE